MIGAAWVAKIIAILSGRYSEMRADKADWLEQLTHWQTENGVDDALYGEVIKLALEGTKQRCMYAPECVDFVAELDESLHALRSGSVASPKLGGAIERLSRHAKSPVALAELDKMRRIIRGESVEEVTGMSIE